MTQLVTAPQTAANGFAPYQDNAKKRAADATRLLYQQHSQRILAYCISRLRNRQDAEDTLQTTFAYAFNALCRGVEPQCELAWLYTIAHNACRTRQRSLRRRNEHETSTDPTTLQETTNGAPARRDELVGLREALLAIPASQRHALLLREWQGLSYREIATQLTLSESAVETLLFRARHTLARRLQPAAQQAALVLAPTPLLRLIRRLASAGGSGKTAAATLALSLASAAPYTIVPAHLPLPGTHRQVSGPDRPDPTSPSIRSAGRPSRIPRGDFSEASPPATGAPSPPLGSSGPAAAASAQQPSPKPTPSPPEATQAPAAPVAAPSAPSAGRRPEPRLQVTVPELPALTPAPSPPLPAPAPLPPIAVSTPVSGAPQLPAGLGAPAAPINTEVPSPLGVSAPGR